VIYQNDFPKGQLRFRRVKHELGQLVSLQNYCDSQFITRSTALHRIHQRKVTAYKLQGRWYVLPPELS
jgi:hypothetical protein